MSPNHDHERALGLAREGSWEEARQILAGLDLADPRIANDLAVSLHQLGRDAEAIDLAPGGDSAFSLNRIYFRKAHELKAGFDPAWKHEDFDGAACPEKPPLVSVIVRTYKRTDLLAQALKSLQEQTLRDVETIVVNDGGDPACEKAARESGAPGLRYYMSEHAGRVAAMNTGLAMAHGKYVTGLDDDDTARPDHLAKLAAALDKAPEVGAVYSGVRWALYSERDPAKAREVAAEERVGNSKRPELILKTNVVPSVMIMARRSCYEEVGRFHTGLEEATNEDWEMWIRLSRRFKLAHLPEVTADMREWPGDANITMRRLRRRPFFGNSVLYLHRALFLLSAPQRPELESAYRKGLELLGGLFAERPEARELLSLRGLWTMDKPYAWFADQGRWLNQLGEFELSARLYAIAARLGPLEPKVWSGLVRTKLGLSTGSGRGH